MKSCECRVCKAKKRGTKMKAQCSYDSLSKALAQQISDEIDKNILDDLTAMAQDMVKYGNM
jgi:hypothetical protein